MFQKFLGSRGSWVGFTFSPGDGARLNIRMPDKFNLGFYHCLLAPREHDEMSGCSFESLVIEPSSPDIRFKTFVLWPIAHLGLNGL